MKKDVSEIYKTLSDIDHTLLRPASFLGSVVSEKSNQYILEEGKFVLKDVIYNPGFHKLFDEIISNSVDESKRPGTSLNTIKVEIDKEKGTISVFDNGGIPVEIHYYFAAMNDSEKAKIMSLVNTFPYYISLIDHKKTFNENLDILFIKLL